MLIRREAALHLVRSSHAACESHPSPFPLGDIPRTPHIFFAPFLLKLKIIWGLVVQASKSVVCFAESNGYLRDFNLWFLRLFLVLSISDMSLTAWVGYENKFCIQLLFLLSQQDGTAILMSVTIVDSELVAALVHLAIVGYLGLSSTHARNQS